MTIALDSALSGLRAAQRSLDLISNNISNASTEGYTRKLLPQESLVVGGNGIGVKLGAVTRNVNNTLLKDLVKQISVKENYNTTTTYLARIQDFHGASEDERSISARISQLSDAFSNLSSSPDSAIQLSATLNAAQQVAGTFNDFSSLIGDMRKQTEGDIASAVSNINQSLDTVAKLNVKISQLHGQGESTADLEDQRDVAIRNVSQYIEVSSFRDQDNKLVLMTRQGQALADESAHYISFEPSNTVLPTDSYPATLSGISVDGINITSTNLGGQIGSLLTMRDQTLPQYQAQIDEMAQKLSERCDSEGLRLFTDSNGTIPASVAPPTPVSYVGYAGKIKVNAAIVSDPSLLRSGTTGQTVLPGSNEIIRKISEFAFGDIAYQQGVGTTDISTGTIFASAGLSQTNQLVGNVDLTDYTPDLGSAPNLTLPAAFTLTVGGTPYNIAINPGDTATDLVNAINTAVGSTVADLNGLGQLRLNTTSDITLADSTIGAAGIAALGLGFGTTTAKNPSFQVQVGTQSPVTITIGPATTGASLVATLNAVPGLSASLGTSGELIIKPLTGGDINLQNISGQSLQALGMTINGVPHAGFRQSGLGPDGSVSTGLVANSSIEDYARGVVTAQSEDQNLASSQADKETAFYNTLDKRQSDTSGVDIDQELSNLIRVQNAYSAAARMITASEKMMDELMNAFAG